MVDVLALKRKKRRSPPSPQHPNKPKKPKEIDMANDSYEVFSAIREGHRNAAVEVWFNAIPNLDPRQAFCRGFDAGYSHSAPLASHTGEAEPVKLLAATMVEVVGTGWAEPLTPRRYLDAGTVLYATPPAATPAAPGEVTDAMVDAYLKANDAYWKRTDELPKSGVKWRNGTPREATRESLIAALSNPAPVAAPAMPALSCKHSNRSDCGLFGMDEAEPAKSSRPSKEWYAAKIAETLDDDFTIGSEAMPIAAPAPASEAVALPEGWRIDQEPHGVLALHRLGTAQPFRFERGNVLHALLSDLAGKCSECGGRTEYEEGEPWSGPSIGCVECGASNPTPRATPTPGDSADAPVQQACKTCGGTGNDPGGLPACRSCVAEPVQQAPVLRALRRISLIEIERGMDGDEATERGIAAVGIARAALKGEQPVEPSGTERGDAA
jgi:hypothetical protein